jgi:hypothetical protein
MVSREELIQKLWPGGGYGDFDHGLNKAVNKLRETLGDSAETPKYIETVARRGYRFVAPVEVVRKAPTNTAGEDFSKPESRPRISWRLIPGGAVVVLLLAAGGYLYLHRPPKLTENDTIVLADFTNTTEDPVFDGTMKTALEVSLGQSPYLNVLSDGKVRETLKLMAKAPDIPITSEIGREICVRNGAKAMVGGSIAALGRRYVITLKAVNTVTEDRMAEELAEADSKEQVITALGKAGTALRGKLGESLTSISRFDTPLARATTSSLDALKAYSLGLAQYSKGDPTSAIPLLQHAIELNPEFASAYAAPEPGARGSW